MNVARATFQCIATLILGSVVAGPATAVGAQEKKPNILVIFGDDIGGQQRKRLFAWIGRLSHPQH